LSRPTATSCSCTAPPTGSATVANGLGTEGLDRHQGSHSLRATVEAHPALRLHVFGHIHEGYGQGLLDRPGRVPLTWLNAASVDERYEPGHAALLVELV